MVIKASYEHWNTYAEQSGLSGVGFEVGSSYLHYYMLFGKHRPMLKIAKLLGVGHKDSMYMELAGPIRRYLCQ